MDKEKLLPWIERLNAADKKDREAIVAELAKGNNLKIPEAWKLLKEAGFNPDAKPKVDPQAKQEAKKQPVLLRHKTEYPRYRRAGLVLTQKPETYEVTEEQLAALKKDKWVVIGDGKEGDCKK